jgi:hypothetical protein
MAAVRLSLIKGTSHSRRQAKQQSRLMVTLLSKAIRRRAGALVALAYLACVLIPPFALIFADSAVAAHCLTGDYHATGVHVHADGTEHRHGHSGSPHDSTDADDKGSSTSCCGLFCFSATPADGNIVGADAVLQAGVLQPSLQEPLFGLGPFRIDRPPNSLASL